MQNPRGFGHGGGGGGGGAAARAVAARQNQGGPKQPDPLQTSVGYIGADAFHRKIAAAAVAVAAAAVVAAVVAVAWRRSRRPAPLA